MTLLALQDGGALTVVVVDDASEQDAARLLQQVAKTAPKGSHLVLLTRRALRFPPALARRVRVVRTTPGVGVESAIAAEVASPRAVVVITAACKLSNGWSSEVAARVALFPDRISQIKPATGFGVLVYPASVTAVDSSPAPWLSAECFVLRANAVQAMAEARSTVSAVMIVKNEEAVLDECLSAVAPFVDEIVVYDTGSTDATMEIARTHGAKVIEGYWDDHFGNARNRALDHATMEWAFQVDADEVVTGDPAEFRARLTAEEYDQISVSIVSSAWQGVETGQVTHPVRLFRRETCRYVGALHEHPKALNSEMSQHSGVDAPVKLIHSGYNLGKVQELSKAARNVAIARREMEVTGPDSLSRTERLSNLARSLMWAGEFEEAAEVFCELRQTPGNASAMVSAGRSGFEFMTQLGRFDEAESWLDTLAAHGEVPGNLATMRARLQLTQGRGEEAAATLAAFRQRGNDQVRDPWALTYDRSSMMTLDAELAFARHDLSAGVEILMSLAQFDPEALNLDLLLRALIVLGRPLTALAEDASEALLARSVREASLYHPSGALAWFDACHTVHPTDIRFVVAGNMFAARADWQVALTWAVRARELGLADVCALRGLGENTTMPETERVMAWLVLAEVLEEPDAPAHLAELIPRLVDLDLKVLRGAAELHGLDVALLTRERDVNLTDTSLHPAHASARD